MDFLHVHLLLNHVPVIGTIGCVIFLIGAMIARSRDLALASLAGLVAVALIALPVFFTGEPAEERLEGVPGISKASIERHEDLAMQALVALEVAGALALATLLVFLLRRRLPGISVTATLLVALVATLLIARAASAGGEIRHTELRGAAAGVSGTEAGEHDDD